MPCSSGETLTTKTDIQDYSMELFPRFRSQLQPVQLLWLFFGFTFAMSKAAVAGSPMTCRTLCLGQLSGVSVVMNEEEEFRGENVFSYKH